MDEIKFENVVLEGEEGTFVVNEYELLFRRGSETYKWPLSEWIRSEKSKKTPKVRITFKEKPIKVTPEQVETSSEDPICKTVLVADFKDGRDKLEEFCNLVATGSVKSRITTTDAQVSQDVPSPQTEPSRSDFSVVLEETDHTKKSILDSNDQLAMLYNNLISTSTDYQGLISSKDFWEHHKLELSTNVPQPQARSNLEGFVAVPPASTVVNSQNVFNYSKELADALIAEDDTIRNLYKKFVQEKKLPEENFWKRILQSRYFYNLIGEKIPENQILYDDIKGVPIRRTHKKLEASDVLRISDPSSELITAFDTKKTFRKKGVHASKRFGKGVSPEDVKEILIQRFNLHSFNVIKDSQSKTASFASDSSPQEQMSLESQVESHRKRKLLDYTQQDLQERGEKELTGDLCLIGSLNMPGVTHHESPTKIAKTESTESMSKIKLKLKTFPSFGDHSQWINDLKNFNINQYIRDSKNDDLVSRRMFVLNTKLCQSEKLMQIVQFEYDPVTVSKMKDIQQEIIEVLQMYFKTLMPEESKRARLLTILRSIKHKIESMNEVGISSHTAKALQSSLLDQITAVEAYDMNLRSYVSVLRSQRNK